MTLFDYILAFAKGSAIALVCILPIMILIVFITKPRKVR